MIEVRLANERGSTVADWLDSRHSFSFGNYQDPQRAGFRTLRVLNEERIKPGAGFPLHQHNNIEIISYVLEGELEHRDNLGYGAVIKAGEVNVSTAGTGIFHSEANPSATKPLHYLQIWIQPDRNDLTPTHEHQPVDIARTPGEWRLLVSNERHPGALFIHQDVRLFASYLQRRQRVRYLFAKGRQGWLHIARGDVVLNGMTLHEGDGVSFVDEKEFLVVATHHAEILLLDLA